MAQKIVLFASLLFVALASGAAFVVWLDYNPVGMSSVFYVELMQHGIHALRPLGAVVNLAWLLTVVSAFLARRDRPVFYLMIAASSCVIAGAVITIFGNWPINNQITTWSINSPPSNWTDLRDEWWRFHIARVILEISGLCFLILASLARRDISSKTA